MRRLVGVGGAALLLIMLAARRFARVAVAGHSMAPRLRDGDWLLIDLAPGPLAVGDVVVARDPRAFDRLIVKRVLERGADERLLLGSDHPAHAEERIGPVAPADVCGRALLRYWPPERIGRIA